MQPKTSSTTNSHRSQLNDQSFDLRLSEPFDDDDSASSRWTWVAAALISGALIASGYLDREPQSFERGSAAVREHRDGPYATALLAPLKATNKTTSRPDHAY